MHLTAAVRRRRQAARNRLEHMLRVPWPARSGGSEAGDRAAIVVVNYDTRVLLSHLIFSLCRILGRDQFTALVVVDNGSRDGSVELLRALHEAGLVHLIANRRQRYHGPALNQALSWLARRQATVATAERVDYILVLDSDTLVLRRDAIGDAVAAMRAHGAAVAGEIYQHPDADPLVQLNSLMLDPTMVWRRRFPPFFDDGDPARALQLAVRAAGLRIEHFPFLHHSYVLHLGCGTLGRIAHAEETDHPLYGWALHHRNPHYTNHPLGSRLHHAVLDAYRSEVSDDSPAALVAACRRNSFYTIDDANPLPPLEELQSLFDQGVDLVQHLTQSSARSLDSREP